LRAAHSGREGDGCQASAQERDVCRFDPLRLGVGDGLIRGSWPGSQSCTIVGEGGGLWPPENNCWPLAMTAGLPSVHAFPMRVRAQVLGTLNLFMAAPRPLSDADVLVAQALAHGATLALLHNEAAQDSLRLTAQLQGAMNSRIAIEQAKGVRRRLPPGGPRHRDRPGRPSSPPLDRVHRTRPQRGDTGSIRLPAPSRRGPHRNAHPLPRPSRAAQRRHLRGHASHGRHRDPRLPGHAIGDRERRRSLSTPASPGHSRQHHCRPPRRPSHRPATPPRQLKRSEPTPLRVSSPTGPLEMDTRRTRSIRSGESLCQRNRER
jgi:hypothetical protein